MKPGWKLLVERFPDTSRPLWDVETVNGHLRAYSVNGCIVIMHDYADGHGWQAYTPVTESGKIEDTLDAIDARTRGIDYDYLAR